MITTHRPARVLTSKLAVGCAALWLGLSPRFAHAEAVGAAAATEAAPAAGSEAAAKEAAQRYDRGLSLYGEGDYALAAIEFERAYGLVPDYRVLYNIGQVRIQLGNYAKALRALEQYLKDGGSKVPAARDKSVHDDLAMLETRTATLRIETNVAGADIVVDDIAVGQAPLAEPLLLDAAEHRVSVQRPGYETKSTRLTLAGRDAETLRLNLEKVQGPTSPIIVKEVVSEPSHRTTWLLATWSATGVLALGCATTELLGVKAAKDLDDMRTHDKTATRGELDSASRRATTLLRVGDVLGGLAILSGGVALYVTLSKPGPTAKEGNKTGSGRRTDLALRPDFIGVTGRF